MKNGVVVGAQQGEECAAAFPLFLRKAESTVGVNLFVCMWTVVIH